jgi:polysaccharide export outer membrane protein
MVLPRLKSFTTLLVISSGLVLAACSGSRPSTGGGEGEFTGSISKTDPSANSRAGQSADKIFTANAQGTTKFTVAAPEDYRISPSDVLEVSVFGVADLTRTVQVSTNGAISLPLIKTVPAAGKTASELEHIIAAKLEADYLQAPQVSVFVKEYTSQRITVDGAVNKPGIFPTSGQLSLLQSIALAEGLNNVADPTGIIVFRTVGNQRMAARFDLKKIRAGNSQDPMLVAGDIVMVDQSAGRTTLRDIREAVPLTGLFSLLAL